MFQIVKLRSFFVKQFKPESVQFYQFYFPSRRPILSENKINNSKPLQLVKFLCRVNVFFQSGQKDRKNLRGVLQKAQSWKKATSAQSFFSFETLKKTFFSNYKDVCGFYGTACLFLFHKIVPILVRGIFLGKNLYFNF